MADGSTPIDLAALPVPKLVEPLDFEGIYQQMTSELATLDPALANIADSNPLAKLLQVCAYRELGIRQRVNVAAEAVLLTTATGSDLDNLVAKEPYNVERLLISPGDAAAIPPVPPVFETDANLRRRAQLAPRRYSTAGPEAAYRFWALTAHPDVADATIASPAPCEVVVTVLSRIDDGTPSAAMLAAVTRLLLDDAVRPLTDQVTVQGARAVDYTIDAALTLYYGPDSQVVLQTANTRLDTYLADTHKLGLDVTRAGIIAALYVPGVQNVTLTAPSTDLALADDQIAHLTQRDVTLAGRDQ